MVDATDVTCEHLNAWLCDLAAQDAAAEAADLASWDLADLTTRALDGHEGALRALGWIPAKDWHGPVRLEGMSAQPTSGPMRPGALAEGLHPDILNTFPGGPDLAAALGGVRIDHVDAYAAVEIVAAFKRVEAWAAGQAALAAAALARKPVMNAHGLPGHAADVELNGTTEELAMRLGTTRQDAASIVTTGRGLASSFADTAESLTAGQISWRKATTIVTALTGVPDAISWAIQQDLLPTAPDRTHTQLARDLSKALIAADQHDATVRHRRALRRQHVTHPRLLPEGVAALTLVAGAEDVVPLDLILDSAAKELRHRGDARTLPELRAEALLILGAGALHTGCLGPHQPSPSCGKEESATAPRDDGAPHPDPDSPRSDPPTRQRRSGPEEAAGTAPSPGSLSDADTTAGTIPPLGRPQHPGTAEGTSAPPERPPCLDTTEDTAGPPDRPSAPQAAKGAAPPQGCPADPDVTEGLAPPLGRPLGPEAADRVLPPLDLLCRPRAGIVLSGERQRIDVRVTVPLSVLLPGRRGDRSTFGGTTANDLVPPADWPDLEPPPTAEVAFLDGYGPITPDVAQALAVGGKWRRLVTDPLSGAVLDVGRTRYRPPAALADHVRTRDGTCTRPGCSTPAARCELDHTVPASHGGPTAHHNLGPACKRDHQLKTAGLFRVQQPRPGTFEWTTPAGHTYRRSPDGVTIRVSPATPGSGDVPY